MNFFEKTNILIKIIASTSGAGEKRKKSHEDELFQKAGMA